MSGPLTLEYWVEAPRKRKYYRFEKRENPKTFNEQVYLTMYAEYADGKLSRIWSKRTYKHHDYGGAARITAAEVPTLNDEQRARVTELYLDKIEFVFDAEEGSEQVQAH